MPQKRLSSPPKDPSPPPSSSSTSEEEEEEEEEEETNDNDISAPVSSQPSKKPVYKKPISEPNQKQDTDSSSEEADADEDDDEEEEDSEDEKAKFVRIESKPTQLGRGKEEDESDSESSSDSDLPPPKTIPARPSRGADPSIKPISSKPMDASPKLKKPATKPVVSDPSPTKSTAQKRRANAPESNDKDSKKRQKPSDADAAEEDDEAGAKKQLFQRIWSPEDEIAILKGMSEFIKKGCEVSADLTGFHEFMKKFLHVEVNRNQISDKIRRLKKKYMNNAEKAKKGKEPSFSKDHEKLAYDLSKAIWGRKASTTEDQNMEAENDIGAEKLNTDKKGASNAKSSRKSKEEMAVASPALKSLENLENHTVVSEGVGDRAILYPHLKESLHSSRIMGFSGFGESDVKRAFELMSHSQAKEWDERLMSLQSKERDIHMERVTCVYELVKQCYDLIKS